MSPKKKKKKNVFLSFVKGLFIIGIAVMSVLGEILYSLLFTLVSLFTATVHYSLYIISY